MVPRPLHRSLSPHRCRRPRRPRRARHPGSLPSSCACSRTGGPAGRRVLPLSPAGGCADRWRSCRWRGCATLPRPWRRSRTALGVLSIGERATESGAARPEEPYGRRRVAPRGVTGTPPAGERRGLVPERPANAAVAGPVSAGCGKATAAPGLPPARAGVSVRAVVYHAAGARRPTPPLVAALRCRSCGLSFGPLCCASRPLANPARCVPWDWSPREACCSPAHPCCSSSLETTQGNPLVAPASRPEAHAPLPMARHGSPP